MNRETIPLDIELCGQSYMVSVYPDGTIDRVEVRCEAIGPMPGLFISLNLGEIAPDDMRKFYPLIEERLAHRREVRGA